MTSHPVFTPSAVDPAELESMTVGRTELLSRLAARIAAAAQDGSRPHTLVVGPRGSGKTHTLQVTLHRVLAEPLAAQQLLVLAIPEDSLAIGSYTDLLVELLSRVDVEVSERARALRRDGDVVGLEHEILDLADGRMVLLAIENLDRVFSAIGQAGQGSFRAWVETSMAITVLATTPTLFSGVSSRTLPWYGSFIVEQLPELTVTEGAQMVVAAAVARGDTELAEFACSTAGLDRLEVIHRLVGGSPRLWHIVSGSVDVSALDALVPAVEALLDQLSPYYQQLLWQLPAGEQRLVVELARSWEPRTVTDLAETVGVSNQSASTALGRLATDRWVVASKAPAGDRRATWYDLTDPLLRYHLQYREERGQAVRLIVDRLRN